MNTDFSSHSYNLEDYLNTVRICVLSIFFLNYRIIRKEIFENYVFY